MTFFYFQTEMKELKERLEIEKQQWIENYMKKQVKYIKPSKLPWFESELPDKDEKYLAFESSTNRDLTILGRQRDGNGYQYNIDHWKELSNYNIWII